MSETTSVNHVYLSATDGLRLHVKAWGRETAASPLVCLPGLARTADDFDAVAAAVAAGRGCAPRRVYALDYRGRGQSDRDRNWRNYDMRVENADILTVLAALEVEHAALLGTSRGGLHILALAATRPGLLQRVILNDIGPVIESKGLARIRGYVGKLPQPKSWADAVDMCKRIMSAQFSSVSDEEWMGYVQRTFEERNGGFVARYDTRLANGLAELDLSVPLPALWRQFDGLRHAPLLAIRGENSDILSPQTLADMAQRHPACDTCIVAGQGHAPLLMDDATIARIASFVAAGD